MNQVSLDDLELKCWDCNGEGFIYTSDEEKEKCSKCSGKGVVLTGLGQTLLHFVKKHITD